MATRLTPEEKARRQQEKDEKAAARLQAKNDREQRSREEAENKAWADEHNRRQKEIKEIADAMAEGHKKTMAAKQKEADAEKVRMEAVAAAAARNFNRIGQIIADVTAKTAKSASKASRQIEKDFSKAAALAGKEALKRTKDYNKVVAKDMSKVFIPSAGAQLRQFVKKGASMSRLPDMPSLVMPNPLTGQHHGATLPGEIDPSSYQFNAPKSKQSLLNRLSGGRLGKVQTPLNSPRTSLLEHGDNAWQKYRDVRDQAKDARRGDAYDKLKFGLSNPAAVAGIAATTTAVTGLGAAVGLFKTVFMATWNYIDEKVLPTTSKLNRALGATTPGMANLRKESMATATQFERLGLGFEHGADIVRTLAVNLRTAEIPSGLEKSLVKISEYTGMGAENAGKLARSFMSTGATTETLGKTLDSVMVDAGDVARQFAVPANLIREQYGDDIDLVQRWGTANTHAMNVAIAKAASYNLSWRQVENTFGKSLDTFENASDMASKLNAAFGTNLDSVKLLNMNSDERMETIRSAIRGVGIEFGSADKFTKNLLVSITGLKDEAEAADVFGSQDQRNKAMARIAMQKKVTLGLDEWKNALGSLGTQLTSIEQLTRNFFMAIGNVIAKLLGFDSGIDMTSKGVKAFEKFMDRLTGKINVFADNLPKKDGGYGPQVLSWINEFSNGLSTAKQSMHDLRNYAEDITTFGEGNASSLADAYENMVKNPQSVSALQKKQLLDQINDTPILQPLQSQNTYRKIMRDTGQDPAAVHNFLTGKSAAEDQRMRSDYAMKLVGNTQTTVNVKIDSSVAARAVVNTALQTKGNAQGVPVTQ